LKDRIHQVVKQRAEQRTASTGNFFPELDNWLNVRLSDLWETTEVATEIEDYGLVQWNGRPLEGVLVKSAIRQRNRIRGAYEMGCFLLGLVDDVEFEMQRDPIIVTCDGADRAVRNWKIRRNFKTQWNAE
jgi:hypothetical protein